MITAAAFHSVLGNGVRRFQQKVESVVGAVAEIDKSSKRATIRSDSGEMITVKTDDNSVCLRIPAGEKTLSKAVPTQFADITIGDRILVHGTKTDQGFVAQRLVVMPAAEVARKREHDLDEWKRRGVGGIVRDVNTQTGEITLELRGAGAGGRLGIETTKANFRRYLAGSLRFEDATASTFAEIKIGDSHVMLADEPQEERHREIGHKAPKSLGGTTVGIMLYVPDVDAVAKQAVAAGAREIRPVVDQFYGDRSGTFLDPFGHVWTIGTHKEDVSSEEMTRRLSQQSH